MVWPLTPWGAGRSPDRPAEPTLTEYDAAKNSPGVTYGRVRGNIFTGYWLEPSGPTGD
jgi:hypothetical protein